MGRGGATTFQQDLQNSDVILIQGSNMAECHPVGFQWVMEAKARGAKIIHVDPRFTRTSALADLHVPIRPGSDIAFLGGIVRYILENDRAFKEYLIPYTNAANLIKKEYLDTEDLGGLFSGWDAKGRRYDNASWQYEGVEGELPAPGHKEVVPSSEDGSSRDQDVTCAGRDETLENPRCVYQILKRHFARYTPEMVNEVCGVEPLLFETVAEELCRNSGRERTGAFCYAVGFTQHTTGVQTIRTVAIIQLLLGNIGRPGGGILALRGHASIQGSTDIPTLFDLLPGYLPMPHATRAGVQGYLDSNTASGGFWSNFPAYFISLMKAWFGDAATAQSDWCFPWLPAVTGDHSHLATVAKMADGEIEGYFVMGENPAVGSSNGRMQRAGLRKLKWLVVRDLVLTETADFWRTAPEVVSGEIAPEEIGTEVFFFPAAAHTEKQGSFTNTQRLLQWHPKCIEPPDDCRSDLHFVYHLGKMLQAHHSGSPDPKDRLIQALTWHYPEAGPFAEPDAEAVLREINGYRQLGVGGQAGQTPCSRYTELRDDGSTACGCWIYAGCFAEGHNQVARRKPGQEQSWVAPQWGWAWPANRRILYNRASADPQGVPWSQRKAYVWWNPGKGEWEGHDVPDFIKDRSPHYRPPQGAKGLAVIGGTDPFIMNADGRAWLFAPAGVVDGPLPTHYEPLESVVQNALYPQQGNPLRVDFRRADNRAHRPFADPRFPFVVTTYRLTEHHTAGGMSRWLSWLSELMPQMFCEVSRELAEERGLRHGEWATVSTLRGEIECRVLVTRRLRPIRLGKRVFHQIGLPYHWGNSGRVRGDSANDLPPLTADPNAHIQESKAFTANIAPGRRSQRKARGAS